MVKPVNAYWTAVDEDQLVDLLFERKASAGDGGNFKEPTFREVSAILTPRVVKGGPKTVKACQNKWAAVSFPCIFCLLS